MQIKLRKTRGSEMSEATAPAISPLFGTSRTVPVYRHFSGKPVPVHREGWGTH